MDRSPLEALAHAAARARSAVARMSRRQPLATSLVVGLLLAGSGLLVSRALSVRCSSDSPCTTLAELAQGAALPEANRIYDRRGDLIAEVGGPLRRAVPAERIPDRLAEAFVAIEDRRFREHDGVDSRGIARAMVTNLRDGEISEGASTIPMQLVRTVWADELREVGRWRRKMIEAHMAPRLLEALGHDRLLALYLNAIYLGNGIYGVERASRHYFGHGVEELTLGQIATLVGMTRAPELHEPRRHPERAREVRDVVLRLLAEQGVVSDEEARAAISEPLDVAPLESVDPIRTAWSHPTAAVAREVARALPELAGAQGLDIYTTIDARIQAEAERALAEQLTAIDDGRFGPIATQDAAPSLEGAAVALDPETSAIRAWVGGRDFTESQFDRVEQARRQVGSLVKPFLVALALERGAGIVDVVSSDTVAIPSDGELWLPADHVWETSLPLREALVRSSNRAAAHLGVALGLESFPELSARMELEQSIPALPSSSIGAFGASLLEMTQAYAAFGNDGRLADAHLVTRIEDRSGALLWENPMPEPRALFEPAAAFVVLDAMRAVVDRGTARSVRGFGYRGPAAGKTGTSNDGRDAWFVGLTPDLVAGVWIGFDAPRPIVEDQGGGALAAPVWATWMRRLEGQIPRTGAWIPPVTVERIRYEVGTGRVIGPLCQIGETGEYVDAWVVSGRYDRSECPQDGGIRRWLNRLWQAISPDGRDEVRPVPRRRGGGA